MAKISIINFVNFALNLLIFNFICKCTTTVKFLNIMFKNIFITVQKFSKFFEKGKMYENHGIFFLKSFFSYECYI